MNATQIRSKPQHTYDILGRSFTDQVLAIDPNESLVMEFEEAVVRSRFLSLRNVGFALAAVAAWVVVLAL